MLDIQPALYPLSNYIGNAANWCADAVAPSKESRMQKLRLCSETTLHIIAHACNLFPLLAKYPQMSQGALIANAAMSSLLLVAKWNGLDHADAKGHRVYVILLVTSEHLDTIAQLIATGAAMAAHIASGGALSAAIIILQAGALAWHCVILYERHDMRQQAAKEIAIATLKELEAQNAEKCRIAQEAKEAKEKEIQDKEAATQLLKRFARAVIAQQKQQTIIKNKQTAIKLDQAFQENRERWCKNYHKRIDTRDREKLGQQRLLPIPYETYYSDVVAFENEQGMEKARDGKTPVILRNGFVIKVLNETRGGIQGEGRKKAEARIKKAESLQAILNLNDVKSTHLIVPPVALCKDYEIAMRVPVKSAFHNMQVYLDHLALFDEPVREFVRLFEKGSLADLVSDRDEVFLKGDSDWREMRADNISWEVLDVDGQPTVRVYLVDTEQFRDSPQPNKIEMLADLFPHHVDVIAAQAKDLGLSFDTRDLEDNGEDGKKLLQLSFSDHMQWAQKQGIQPADMFTIPSEIVEGLIDRVTQKMCSLNSGQNEMYLGSTIPAPRGFLDPAQIPDLAQKLTPALIAAMQESIRESQANRMHGAETHLLESRSFVWYQGRLPENVIEILGFYNANPTVLVEPLIYFILDQLQEKGVMHRVSRAKTGTPRAWIQF